MLVVVVAVVVVVDASSKTLQILFWRKIRIGAQEEEDLFCLCIKGKVTYYLVEEREREREGSERGLTCSSAS